MGWWPPTFLFGWRIPPCCLSAIREESPSPRIFGFTEFHFCLISGISFLFFSFAGCWNHWGPNAMILTVSLPNSCIVWWYMHSRPAVPERWLTPPEVVAEANFFLSCITLFLTSHPFKQTTLFRYQIYTQLWLAALKEIGFIFIGVRPNECSFDA